jgi:thermitase
MSDSNVTSANLLSRWYDWSFGAPEPGEAGTPVQGKPAVPKCAEHELIVQFYSHVTVQPQNNRTDYPSLNQLFAQHGVYHLHRVFPDNLEQSGRDPRRQIGQLPDLTNVYLLKVAENQDIGALVEQYRKDPNVKSAEPNYVRSGRVVPNDPMFSANQWNLGKIMAAAGWDIQKGDENLIIAVIDGGVNYNHPDIAASMWKKSDGSYGWNFDGGNNDPMDYFGHGTAAAGIPGAVTDNHAGLAGITWGSKIMAVKACNDSNFCYDSNTSAAIKYAVDNGAKIISMSWGSYQPSSIIRDAILYAKNAGVILVASAGNDGTREPVYPAAYDGVISVGATDQYDALACNKGTWVSVYAPGIGVPVLSAGNNGYTTMSGTSFAGPHVAGLSDLLLSHNSALAFSQVIDILTNSCDAFGQGSPDALGWCRINMARALSQSPTADPNVKAFITAPAPYQVFGPGQIGFAGFAAGSTFSSYSLAIAAGENPAAFSPNGFTLVGGGKGQVSDDQLATFDARTLSAAGIYTAKLSVAGTQGTNNRVLSFIFDPDLVPGWPKTVGLAQNGASTFVPGNSVTTFADLGGDGTDKLIVSTGAGDCNTYVWNADGSTVWSNYNGCSAAAPAVGDLDRDGRNEVVAVGQGMVYAWRGDTGKSLGGNFPVSVPNASGTPSVADINNDGKLEIIVPTSNGTLYALNSDGSALWNTAVGTNAQIIAPVSLCSLNGDQNLAAIFGAGSSSIYALDQTGKAVWTKALNSGNTYPVTCADLNQDGYPEIMAGVNYKFYVLDRNSNDLWSRSLNRLAFSGIPAGLAGDGSLSVIVADVGDAINVWDRLGANISPFPVTAVNRQGYGLGIISGNIAGSGYDEFVVPLYKDEGTTTTNGGIYSEQIRLYNKNGEIINASWPKTLLGHADLSPALGHPTPDGACYLAASTTYFNGTKVFLYKTPASCVAQANGWLQYGHDTGRTGNNGIDVIPPTITTTPVVTSPVSADIPVTMQATDNVGIRVAKLWYKNTSSATYQFVEMACSQPIGQTTTCQATIPGSVATMDVQYYLTVNDLSPRLNPAVSPLGAPTGTNVYNVTIVNNPTPGPEAGPEPGPEAGPELGLEPGPEPSLDAGVGPKPEAGPETGPDLSSVIILDTAVGLETPIVIIRDGAAADTASESPAIIPDGRTTDAAPDLAIDIANAAVEAGTDGTTDNVVVIPSDAPVVNSDAVAAAEAGQDAVPVNPNPDAGAPEAAQPAPDAGNGIPRVSVDSGTPPITKHASGGCSCNLGGR